MTSGGVGGVGLGADGTGCSTEGKPFERLIAALLVKGVAHPSIPLVIFRPIRDSNEQEAFRRMTMEFQGYYCLGVIGKAPIANIHYMDIRSGVPTAIHYFADPGVVRESSIDAVQSAFLDNCTMTIAMIHGVLDDNKAAYVLPWVWAEIFTGTDPLAADGDWGGGDDHG